ncbi:MAG: ABC transporter substrate-binding protein [Cyanobacteria bacterium J06592_8]
MWQAQIDRVIIRVDKIWYSCAQYHRAFTHAGLLLSLSILTVACDGTNISENQDNPTPSETPTQGSVTILGAITGPQQQQLEAALTPFVEETGIEVIYQGTEAFSTLLPVRVEAGNAPDIAMFPQPALMAEFAKKDLLVPLTTIVDQEALKTAFSEDWRTLASVNGKIYGIWYRAAVKSLVWYNPQAFASAGYKVPKTWNEMIALSDQIVADGQVPWCLGMESGDATGWVGTDWIEDIILRTDGPEVYDQWVQNKIPFNAPAVRDAFERFGEIALNPKYVVGGTVGLVSIPFGLSPNGLFTDPPECYLHRQASFISSFFPEGVELGKNVDIFPLPPINPEYGLPILIGGDMVAMFNDTPAARKLMQYLASVKPHAISAQMGGYISPHQGVSLDLYPDSVSRKQASILLDADIIRFDGSDLMPTSVGTGTFWLGILSYIDDQDLDTVLVEIEQSWPDKPTENQANF